MSHVIQTKLDTETAPDDAGDRVETIKAEYRPILENLEREYRTRTDADDEPLYDEFLVRFDIRDDLEAIVDEVVGAFEDDVDWMVIETRQDDREWRDDAFSMDASYYPPEWTDSHRTPPSLERAGLFDVAVGDVHYLLGGEEYAVEATTIKPDAPEKVPRQDVVAVDENERINRLEDADRESVPDDAIPVGLLEVHPGKVVVIDVEDVEVETTDWETAHEHGDVQLDESV